MDYWSIILITLIFSAFFSGMEIAFISSNKLKIEVDKDKDLTSGLISFFARMPSKFVGALLLGNNIALVIYGIYMSKLLEPLIIQILPDWSKSEFSILLIQTIISTLIILFFAEFIPKVLFRLNSNAILKTFAVPVVVFYYIFYPVIYVYTGISHLLIKYIIRSEITESDVKFGYADLHNYVQEYGIDDDENERDPNIQFLQNAIDFNSVKLRECMIPRIDMVAVDQNEEVQELIKKFIETGFSRILVYKDSIDEVIGYIHSGDLFTNPKSIAEIIRSLPLVPETMKANDILSKFIEEKKSIAVVLDEFGGTSGIITMEDLIEEILGEIEDEFDDDEHIERKISDSEYLLSARLEIDYLNDTYKLNLPESEEYETLGGLILYIHKSIPIIGDEMFIENFQFKITQSSMTKIEIVQLLISQDID